MKNLKALPLLLLTIAITLVICSNVSSAKSKSVEPAPSFEESKAWNKVGPNLQKAWLAAKKSGDMEQNFKCFVRVRSPYNMGDQSFLQSRGFNVQLFSGNVGRGSVSAEKLPNVADLYFVRKINLSGKKD